ncbi:MAG: hypothetical protein F4110_13935 [Acidimicrobiaceae bacterium]|nr:hypothetical protein [Acidimicrobiaceae bacterium]MYH42765.1 hypothetical protein [Acidimicrobiaceae bacterium]MYI55058.1 hypothetical protein [Acidimicrobiaceae bacterium]MYK74611.1 hypothetical protein [Acidimicrobiaceae bacterium]
MKYAMGRGLRESDPTAAALAAMPKLRHRPNHERALHHSDLPYALKMVRVKLLRELDIPTSVPA